MIGFYDAIIDQPYDLLLDIINFLGAKKSKLIFNNINQKINASEKTVLSSDIKDYIIQKYAPMIKQLSLQFGGYCKKWEQQINNKKVEDRNFPASIRI